MVSNLGELDDTYTLSEDRGDKPEDVCNDGCVYTRDNPDNPDDEYCFKSEITEGDAQCQVWYIQQSQGVSQYSMEVNNFSALLSGEIKFKI